MAADRALREGALARWGRWVYRRRWLVLAASALLLAGSIVVLAQGASLTNQNPTDTESGHAARLIQDELPRASGASFVLVFGSDTLAPSDAAFQDAVKAALLPMRVDARVASVATPYDAGTPEAASAMLSRDGHHAIAIVSVKDEFATARAYYPELRAKVHAGPLDVLATGNLAINSDFDAQLQKDLERAEIVSLPLTLLLLALVFGTLVAAILPLGVGALAVVGGIAGVFLLARVTDVSQYAINITTLVGLGVAIDYSLFVVSRYREEVEGGARGEDAVARTLATAGRAVAYSGVTVAIGLSGMLFYRGTFLASMGLAGAIVVALAVLYALTFLPALLAVLGPRVDKGRLPLPRRREGLGFWHALAMGVMRRPIVVLVPVLAFLAVAGSPFLNLRLANGDVTMLPTASESRRGYELLLHDFPGQDQTRMVVVAHFPGGDPLSRERVDALFDLSRRLASLPNVLHVSSVVDLDRNLTRADYERMYAPPRDALAPVVAEAVKQSVGKDVVVLNVLTAKPASSDEARALVAAIRETHRVADGETLVAGQTAFDVDTIAVILGDTPAAVAFVIVVTYLLIFLQVRSVLIPLKAVVMNLLSISASFGALVWVFQEGHLSGVLSFTAQSIDPSLPVILFCIVFGLSMDYEVLLLSRMHEEYERSRDNEKAVALGLEKSGKLITGAAAIMVVVFSAFALAGVVIIKSIGFGLALAIAIDATLVRALVVPATMRLLGDLNWWAPRWVRRGAP